MAGDPDFSDPFDDDLLAGLGGEVTEDHVASSFHGRDVTDALRSKLGAKFASRPEAVRQWTVGNTVAMLVLMILSCACGGWIFHGSPSPTSITSGTSVTDAPRPVKTVTVTATRTIAAVPESCQAAMQYTQEILPYVGKILNAATPTIEALQDAYVAVAQKDYAAINRAQTKMHNIEISLSEPGQEYNQLLKDATTSMTACLDQLNGR